MRGYYYKLLDSWTPPLYHLPRWFDANSYPTLTDFVAAPTSISFVSSSLTLATSLSVPWFLSSSTTPGNSPPGSGSTLQRLFEVFTLEREILNIHLVQTALSRSFLYDVSEPLYAWIVESLNVASQLAVLTNSGSSIIEKAESDLDLFYSGGWRWKQEGNTILVFGLELQEQTTQTVSGWQCVTTLSSWASANLTYVQHPATKNWFPRHPSKMASGNTNFYYGSALKIRSPHPEAAVSLDRVQLYIDGEVKIGRRIQLKNSLDEKGLYFHLSRVHSETNENYSQVILATSWFKSNTYKGVRDYLSTALRSSTVVQVSPSATGFTLPASSVGYSVRNISQRNYVYESPVVSGTNYLTKYASAEMGCAYLKGLKTDFTSSSGVVSFDTYTSNTDKPIIHWKLNFWNESGSSVVFTDNLPENIPDLIVLHPSKVRVNRPSENTLRKSFKRTSPSTKWQRIMNIDEGSIGLAEFDF